MKKRILGIVLVGVLLACALVGCVNTSQTKTLLEIKEDNILTAVFSDMYFDGTDTDATRKKIMDKVMYNDVGELKYGLIVVNGNLVNGEDNGRLMKIACDAIDSYGLPWTVTLGPKDIDGNTSKQDIIKILLSYENCYFMAGDSYGDATYALDIIYNDKLVHTMYFLDTSEGFSENQAIWYSNTVRRKADKYGTTIGKNENVISSVFMSRPFQELKPLVDEWQTGDSNLSVYRDITTLDSATNLYKFIKELDSTYAVFFGDNTYSYFIKTKNDIQYAMCRNMDITDDENQKNLYGAVYFTAKNNKYLNISSQFVRISELPK